MAIPSLDTYGTVQVVGFPGGLAEPTRSGEPRSFLNEGATAIDFGVAVGRGVATAAGQTDKCKAVTAGTEIIIGISMRNASNIVANSSNVINYAQYAAVPVLTDGVIFVTAGEAVAEGDTCLFIVGTQLIGSVQTGALAGTTRVAMPAGTIWLDTAASGAIGRVRIKNSTT